MNKVKCFFSGLLMAGTATAASADGSEFMLLGTASETESTFFMASFRQDLDGNDGGLGLRFDAIYGKYPTFYDGTDGDGTFNEYRILLRYDVPMTSSASLILNGGAVYRSEEVRPVTMSSPDDYDEWGGFLSAEFFNYEANGNDLHLIGEINTVGAEYAAATYLFNAGGMKFGPTANYVVDDDYDRWAVGASASFEFSEYAELKGTIAYAEQSIDGLGSEDASYIEFQLTTRW